MTRKMILAIIISAILIIAAVSCVVFLVEDTGEFGTDYWFVMEEDGTETLKTADGWTFDLNIVQDYTLEGIVLGVKYYHINDSPYSPINTFSPMDILVGVDDVADNVGKYDYSITRWEDREVEWFMYYDDVSDYEYFKTHTGNNHLIPHTDLVYSKMFEMEEGDKFVLGGYIVEPSGTRGDEWYTWPSDNQIGNYDCEVILVDYIIMRQ
jgi:hypothetical protein